MSLENNIRVDCYLSILKKMKLEYPEDHFEVITRTAQSVLSPSRKLLTIAKAGGMNFETYKIALIEELDRSEKAKIRLKQLKQIAEHKLLFLVCFEKDASQCHRSIVKELILKV